MIKRIFIGLMISLPAIIAAQVYLYEGMTSFSRGWLASIVSVGLMFAGLFQITNSKGNYPITSILIAATGVSYWSYSILSTPIHYTNFGSYIGVLAIAILYAFFCYGTIERYKSKHKYILEQHM